MKGSESVKGDDSDVEMRSEHNDQDETVSIEPHRLHRISYTSSYQAPEQVPLPDIGPDRPPLRQNAVAPLILGSRYTRSLPPLPPAPSGPVPAVEQDDMALVRSNGHASRLEVQASKRRRINAGPTSLNKLDAWAKVLPLSKLTSRAMKCISTKEWNVCEFIIDLGRVVLTKEYSLPTQKRDSSDR